MNFADTILNQVFSEVENPQNAWAVDELLNAFDLNWKVEKQQLFLPDGTPTNFNGIVRADTNKCFTTCKDAYTPFQNSELAEMLIKLSEKTGYNIHNGGMFNGGGKVYLQLESPNKIVGIGENKDVVNGYLTGLNGHDGTTSLKWGETNFTISCRNTFMAASKQLVNKVRHTQGMHKQIELAIRQLNGVVKEEKTLFDTFIKLSEIAVQRDAIVKIVEEVTTVDITKTTAELKKDISPYSINRANELLKSISTEMNQKGQTLWGLFSGVTQYTSHVMPAPKRENGRLESIYTGSAFDVNNTALKSVLEYA